MARSPISRSTIVAGLLAGIFGIAAGRAEAWPWPWVNPEIHNSGAQVTGAYYDPFTGRWVIRTDRTRVRESFLDPHRLHVDPGSKHYVDTIQVDAHGVQWRVFGWKWTSHGVPHGDVRRVRVGSTGIPGIDHEENDRVLYSYRPGSQNKKPKTKFGSRSSVPSSPGAAQPPSSLSYHPF